MVAKLKGRRASKQRQIILEVLRSTKDHPTADWIYSQVRKVIPNISLGTVYRNLNVLKEQGEIVELCYGKGYSRFDGDVSEHAHIRCLQCDRVEDLPSLKGKDLQELAKCTKYKLIGYRLEFFGVCPDCLSVKGEYT